MAAVLDALAPYVKKLIADMAQEEVSMLLGVSSEITKLEDNMEGLKAFLKDAERRRITDMSRGGSAARARWAVARGAAHKLWEQVFKKPSQPHDFKAPRFPAARPSVVR